jgi:hypothetical protein
MADLHLRRVQPFSARGKFNAGTRRSRADRPSNYGAIPVSRAIAYKVIVVGTILTCLVLLWQSAIQVLSAGKDLARTHPTTPDQGVAHGERLQASRGPPLQSSRRLGICRQSGPGSRAEQKHCLTPSRCASAGRRLRGRKQPLCDRSSRKATRSASDRSLSPACHCRQDNAKSVSQLGRQLAA